jgi:hypothetical protein
MFSKGWQAFESRIEDTKKHWNPRLYQNRHARNKMLKARMKTTLSKARESQRRDASFGEISQVSNLTVEVFHLEMDLDLDLYLQLYLYLGASGIRVPKTTGNQSGI